MGYALCLDKLVNTTGDCELCFKPLSPPLESKLKYCMEKKSSSIKSITKIFTGLKK